MIYVSMNSWVNINNDDRMRIPLQTKVKKSSSLYISKLLNSFIISKCQDINGLHEHIKSQEYQH